jgi:hypothetical protein
LVPEEFELHGKIAHVEVAGAKEFTPRDKIDNAKLLRKPQEPIYIVLCNLHQLVILQDTEEDLEQRPRDKSLNLVNLVVGMIRRIEKAEEWESWNIVFHAVEPERHEILHWKMTHSIFRANIIDFSEGNLKLRASALNSPLTALNGLNGELTKRLRSGVEVESCFMGKPREQITRLKSTIKVNLE